MNLSKSKLLAYRQCKKRLWLEVKRPELRQDSGDTLAGFSAGHAVGDVARELYDPEGKGQLVDAQTEGFARALARSRELLASSVPIFEAGFCAGGALAFADIMLPHGRGRGRGWRMVEVKSSASVKDHHRDDVAVQAYVARLAGVPLRAICVAHVDSGWTYPGGRDYRGLLVENDLTAETLDHAGEVKAWISEAQAVAALRREPDIATGAHCHDPFECGFIGHCGRDEILAQHPVSWLPHVRSHALKRRIREGGVSDLSDVPDELLDELQLRVKQCSLSGEAYFDGSGAADDLAGLELPACFLDFESISFAVPVWAGTRPYQQIPFQFSLHRLTAGGELGHESFLDLSGDDPSPALARALIRACGDRGPIFVYSHYEAARIRDLAGRFPMLRAGLLAINERIVDLLPVARSHYYHPNQEGSWSIKKVLAAIDPENSHAGLDGIRDGGMAMQAFAEAISAGVDVSRKEQIERELLEYCTLDTMAMVRIWARFTGRKLTAR